MLVLIASALGGEPAPTPVQATRARESAQREPAELRVHWAEVRIRSRPSIRESDYPAEAKGMPATRCLVTVHFNTKGDPTSAVASESCPEVFRASAQDLGMQFRIRPWRVEGAAVPIQFDIAFNYKPSED